MTTVLLKFPHGLGDVVQFGVVLKHLRKHRPAWSVDVVVGRGKHTALAGLCRRVYHDQEQGPQGQYDTIIDIGFFENYSGYDDRPGSKITNCLHEVFGLGWDRSLGRYEVNVSDEAMLRAAAYLRTTGAGQEKGKFKVVLIHGEGNTSTWKKNIEHWQVQALCNLAIRVGRVPVILDWDRRCPLPDQKTIFNPGCGDNDIWGGFGSGDAGVIAALIHLSEAYIGIDSGPGKIASATETPSLICWKGHHPIQFHDPASNTVHLIPADHAGLPPVNDHSGMLRFFLANYNHRVYAGEHGMVAQACAWLAETLGETGIVSELAGQTFVLPGGIGDVMWALLKIKSVAGGRPIDVIVSGDPRREVDRRAIPFLNRFPFVRTASVMNIPIHPDKDNRTNNRGRYIYEADGLKGAFHFLIPNTTLEAGARIETWLPAHPVDWGVIDEFSFEGTARGDEMGTALNPFVAFYLGPESGHCREGHNKDFLWEPKHWVALGKMFTERGCTVAVIGASYDISFWERYVEAGVREAGMHWIDLIGDFEIGETFAFLKRAKCLISYQCGLGIVGHYLGVNVGMWWRPDGNTCHPEKMVSFSNAMKDSWVRPGREESYLGMLYLEQTPGDIIAEVDRRGWLK